LGQFAGNDQNVSLNLSKLMQQGLFNGIHGALAVEETMQNSINQPVLAMPKIKSSSAAQSQDENSLKIRVSKHDNNYQLRYEWTSSLAGFMTDISSSVPANSRESEIIASTTITISEDDLRNGNFENYQITDIDYRIHFELDPVALAYQAAN
ncbi:MAG: hypothetical protein KDK04_29255, partial [Candidatus Competibacteraceae bacterium]|nr:hypothetical protein [Candidatus Competibacteraceae bacterium]